MKNASDMLPNPDWSEFYGVVSGKSQTTGWVLCSEMLPNQPNQKSQHWYTAICYCKDGFIRALDYSLTAAKHGRGYWWDGEIKYEVTHWMSLPNPPNVTGEPRRL